MINKISIKRHYFVEPSILMFSIFCRLNRSFSPIKTSKCFISEIRLNRDRTNDLIPEVGSLCCFYNETSRNKPFIIVEKSHGSCIGLIPSGVNIWVFLVSFDLYYYLDG